MKNSYNFINKNIFVGGSSKGIGWESAKLFAEFGGNVTLVSRNIQTLKQKVGELSNNGHQLHNSRTKNVPSLCKTWYTTRLQDNVRPYV